MAEYIEREALVSDLESLARNQDGFRQSVILGVVHYVKCVPAADVAPAVHGWWEFAGGDDDENLYGWCSVCNKHWKEEHIENFNYCPHCGARMDGE